ncbi:unnamed protein product [Anisakis simplex]|uniref:Uncharacterized protein n=1 Tax=Anisakis simplex TaxID=6269 RepID=A0A3P6QPM6_ANISI|nr:unnamed protein product [Anisakis simplex]
MSELNKDKKSRARSRSSSASSNDEKHQQGFFVGGSEHSGQQVLGPSSSSRNSSHNDLISMLFESARSHGAEAVTPDESGAMSRHSNHAVKFKSAGYRLGDSHAPSESVLPSHPTPTDEQQQEQNLLVFFSFFQQEVILKMWENGFSIDDGPLRTFDDPESRSFLQSIMQGHIPVELVRQYPGRVIDLRMERKTEPYQEPKLKPFSGHGQRLGDIVPPIVGAGTLGQKLDSSETGHSSESVSETDPITTAQQSITLRDGEPTTQVQIRLPNGQRIIGRFNHTHTVEEVRSFIVAAVPEFAFQPFYMMTTFPSKVIEQERETLKDAGLLNSRIFRRMGLLELTGFDKVLKAFRIIKQIGGVRAAIRKRYLMDETRVGTLVGEDKFGHKYYENNEYYMPRNRWVEFPEYKWLEYDATQVPPEWHRWLHHMTDKTPIEDPPVERKWILTHEENLSIFDDKKFIPYSTTRAKITGWQPGTRTGKP